MIKKGLVVSLFGVMLGVVIIILAIAFAPGLTNAVKDIRNQTTADTLTLNCFQTNGSANTTLNNFQEANCIVTDLQTPTFILVLIGIAGAVIGAKILLT